MDVGKWWDFANSTLPKNPQTGGFDVPDSAYNAIRENFFYQNIAPEIAKAGYSPEGSKQKWMQETERPGRTSFPTLELAGASALSGLVGPVAALTRTDKPLKEYVESKRKEAELQEVGTIKKGIAELGGELMGSAPYFMGTMGAVGAAGEALKLTKTATKLMELPVMGAVQGLYDAAKADEGHRISEGLAGFAFGTGVGALVEAKPLWRLLKEKHGLGDEVAKAVEEASRGVGNDTAQEMANTVVNAMPEVGNTIEEWVTGAVKNGRKLGNPIEPPQVTPDGKLWMKMQGADGKAYNLTGLGGKDLEKVIGRIGAHLEKGGQIVSMQGDTDVLHQFYKQLDGVMGLQGQGLPADIAEKVAGVERAAAVAAGSESALLRNAARNPLEDAEKLGATVEMGDDGVRVTLGKSTKVFATQEEAEAWAKQEFGAPNSAPTLLDETHIAPGAVTGSGTPNMNKPPGDWFPAPPPSLGKDGIKGGAEMFSFFVRPFYAWVDTVEKKHGVTGLYDVMKNVDRALSMSDVDVTAVTKLLDTSAKKFDAATRRKMTQLARTAPEKWEEAAVGLGLEPKHVAAVRDVVNRVPDLERFLQYKKNPFNMAEDVLEEFDFIAEHGNLKEAGEDIYSLAHLLAEGRSRYRNVEPALKAAQEFINRKVDDAQESRYLLGDLRPLFQRHMEYMRGHSDRSQKVVDGMVNSAINLMNQGIDGVNSKLPSHLRLGKIKGDAKDAMGRFLLFSYAGSMGMRPVSVFRDGMQVLMTTYPMLGEKYMTIGLQKAFGNRMLRKEELNIPEKYGALVHHRELQNLYAAAEGGLEKGAVTKVAEWALKPMEKINNGNRLVSFWGHQAKALDAIHRWRDDPKAFIKESGLVFADDAMQASYLAELPRLTNEEQFKDMSYRIAKDMTDLSQWNYKRGAHPGMYKYALGRLLGQYGTWPMNYVEYARRLASKGDVADKVIASTRLGVAHGAVLAAGNETGVDTASWVFQHPAMFTGSPLMEKLTALPAALDTQSQRGAEARRKLMRTPEQVIPMGTEFMDVYRAFMQDEGNFWKTALGFNELTAKESEKGLNALF